ncbi:hypothetical protein HF866_05900 [Lactobacillus ruminis]|nr:hypothetical protein [Ligilactobacillus ruminis]
MKNDCLSVKCVLLTDKSPKKGILSVKLRKILAKIGRASLHLKMPDKVSRTPTSFVRLFV